MNHPNILLHREIWPENDCFGAASAAPEEEFMLLHDIFTTNLGPGKSPKFIYNS